MAGGITMWITQVKRAQDARKKSDLHKLRIALEHYTNDHGCYPDEVFMSTCGGAQLASYNLLAMPCERTDVPYYYEPVDVGDLCKGYRIYTNLGDKSDLDIDVPACIESKIIAIQNNSVTNPPTEVWRWVDNNKVYYYITSDCCDQFNLLYDTQCNLICAPDGGFSGQGDGNCPTFSNNISKTLVWIDERN